MTRPGNTVHKATEGSKSVSNLCVAAVPYGRADDPAMKVPLNFASEARYVLGHNELFT